jgi:uncharacterized membrane-anchored protein YhcB (DUF1043 family)
MSFGSIVLVAFILVLFGVLIGCTLSERWLGRRARRQAEMQRSLDRQWQELDRKWQALQGAGRENYSGRMGRFESVRM